MIYYVYIIYNKKCDKFYTGQTWNIGKRLTEHNLGLSGYTSKYDGGWVKVYEEKFNNRIDAIKREKFLKKQKNKNFYRKLCGLIPSSQDIASR